MYIKREEYNKYLKDFNIYDCSIADKDQFYFISNDGKSKADPVMRQGEIDKRIVRFDRNSACENSWAMTELEGMDILFSACSITPEKQFIAVDALRQVFTWSDSEKSIEKKVGISFDGPTRGPVNRLKQIGGELYAVSARRGVCKRVAKNQWESLCPPVDFPSKDKDAEIIETWGFEDLDGFNENDIYACGGRGDVWRALNGEWSQIDFPSNMILESILCAPDGKVYVGAQSGTVFGGAGNEWKMLWKGDLSLPFKHLAWFNDTLWGCNSYGLWRLENNEMAEVKLPDEIKVCATSLRVNDGVMLMASQYGAAFFDGNEWKLIFNIFKDELK